MFSLTEAFLTDVFCKLMVFTKQNPISEVQKRKGQNKLLEKII